LTPAGEHKFQAKLNHTHQIQIEQDLHGSRLDGHDFAVCSEYQSLEISVSTSQKLNFFLNWHKTLLKQYYFYLCMQLEPLCSVSTTVAWSAGKALQRDFAALAASKKEDYHFFFEAAKVF